MYAQENFFISTTKKLPKRFINLSSFIPSIFIVLFFVFLLSPIIVIIVTSFTETSYITFPPQGFSLKWYTTLLNKSGMIQSVWVSFKLAIFTAIISTIIGSLAAIAINRYQFPGRDMIAALCISPLILPTIITGIAILRFFVVFFPSFRWSMLSLVLGHVIITLPFPVRMVSAVLQRTNISLEEAARTLGARPIQAFLKVTFPLISSGIISGFLFSYIISFDQFPVSLFLAGPKTPTLPIMLYEATRWAPDPSIASISTLSIIFTITILFILNRFISLTDIKP